MATVILDTDFLSSFLKIGCCDLIRQFYQTDQVTIPLAVYRELAQTELLAQLLEIRWIVVDSVAPLFDDVLLQDAMFQALGSGEQSCIHLARTLDQAVLLMNDNKAGRCARSLALAVTNIPAFLLACRRAGLVSRQEMEQIIRDLKEQDFYEFKAQVRDELLK